MSKQKHSAEITAKSIDDFQAVDNFLNDLPFLISSRVEKGQIVRVDDLGTVELTLAATTSEKGSVIYLPSENNMEIYKGLKAFEYKTIAATYIFSLDVEFIKFI